MVYPWLGIWQVFNSNNWKLCKLCSKFCMYKKFIQKLSCEKIDCTRNRQIWIQDIPITLRWWVPKCIGIYQKVEIKTFKEFLCWSITSFYVFMVCTAQLRKSWFQICVWSFNFLKNKCGKALCQISSRESSFSSPENFVLRKVVRRNFFKEKR